MKANVRLTVNGRSTELSADPERPLLDVLREDLGLTGTKFGCGEGHCRACTVLLDGNPVRACVTPIQEAAEHTIETIESLAKDSKLHPVQEAFIAEGAMQCGYCVPGMILRTVGLLRRIPAPTPTQILDAMNGNLCRCCGYLNILKAVQRAAANHKEAR